MFPMNEKTRREFVKLSSMGVFGVGMSGWMNVLAARAEQAAPTGLAKRIVLIWQDGGPSHKDTWDLKPTSKGAGQFKQIKTSAPGVMISEHLPKLSKFMHKGTIIRGMSTSEGAHPRAKYTMHTGYREGQGGVNYPSLGSIVAQEIGNKELPIPNYVTIGARSYGSGFLGPKYSPLVINNPTSGVADLAASVGARQFSNRVDLLQEMESAFYHEYRAQQINDHKTNYARAVTMMQSKEAKAFDLSGETSETKARYGSGTFNQSCLMARRLLEVGVPFVEVSIGGWDNHQDIFSRLSTNLLPAVDGGVSALLTDLQDRSMLESTLVIIMGEFGRTPNINTRSANPGRDHYPRAWSLAMFGGGVKGGYVHGRTDKEGAIVEEGKTSAQDFMATVCALTGIDYKKENITPSQRPIRIVDKVGKPVEAILS